MSKSNKTPRASKSLAEQLAPIAAPISVVSTAATLVANEEVAEPALVEPAEPAKPVELIQEQSPVQRLVGAIARIPLRDEVANRQVVVPAAPAITDQAALKAAEEILAAVEPAKPGPMLTIEQVNVRYGSFSEFVKACAKQAKEETPEFLGIKLPTISLPTWLAF